MLQNDGHESITSSFKSRRSNLPWMHHAQFSYLFWLLNWTSALWMDAVMRHGMTRQINRNLMKVADSAFVPASTCCRAINLQIHVQCVATLGIDRICKSQTAVEVVDHSQPASPWMSTTQTREAKLRTSAPTAQDWWQSRSETQLPNPDVLPGALRTSRLASGNHGNRTSD